jgi:methylmalonyl-CoA mutase N-terminal domain/subunit
MLTGPLSGIVMMLAGAPVSGADASAAKARNQPARLMMPTRFDLASTDAKTIRSQLSVSGAPEFRDFREAPDRDARYSVAGLAMGLGQAAVDNDRFDMRTLRLERGRGGRMSGPFDAGLRLKLTGDRRSMKADVGLTGGVMSVVGKALTD